MSLLAPVDFGTRSAAGAAGVVGAVGCVVGSISPRSSTPCFSPYAEIRSSSFSNRQLQVLRLPRPFARRPQHLGDSLCFAIDPFEISLALFELFRIVIDGNNLLEAELEFFVFNSFIERLLLA
jgi:hypothetical protein